VFLGETELMNDRISNFMYEINKAISNFQIQSIIIMSIDHVLGLAYL